MDDHNHNERGGVIESSVAAGAFAYGGMSLLGVWRSSWELRQEDYVAGARIRYPAGYGSVVPGEKLLEILNMPNMKEKRELAKKEAQKANRAKRERSVPDAIPASEIRKRFDATLKTMLETPPDPKSVKSK
jgi:hypothetical protein